MDIHWLNRGAASATRARAQIQQRGFSVNGAPLWTESELKIMADLYPDYSAIAALLPHRTRQSLYYAAWEAGLSKPKKLWTGAEISKLRKLWQKASADEVRDAFPGVTWLALERAANSRGFRRPHCPFKTTGSLILDQIRQRCFEIGWSMVDLDDAAGTGKYFAARHWRGHKPNYGSLDRAVAALGGVMVARWDEEVGQLRLN